MSQTTASSLFAHCHLFVRVNYKSEPPKKHNALFRAGFCQTCALRILTDKGRKTTLVQFENIEQVRQSLMARIKKKLKKESVVQALNDKVRAFKQDAKKELDKWDSRLSCISETKKDKKDLKKEKTKGKNKKKNHKRESHKKSSKVDKKKQKKQKKSGKKRKRASSSSSSSSDSTGEEEVSDSEDASSEEESKKDERSDSDADTKSKAPETPVPAAQQSIQASLGKKSKAPMAKAKASDQSSTHQGDLPDDDDDGDLFGDKFSPQQKVADLSEELKELLHSVEHKFLALESDP